MLGKLAGAWLGEKIAGPNRGAKGAILGFGAAASPGAAFPRSQRYARRLGLAQMARQAPRARRLSVGSDAFFASLLSRVFKIRLDLPVQFDRHRLAVAIAAAAATAHPAL